MQAAEPGAEVVEQDAERADETRRIGDVGAVQPVAGEGRGAARIASLGKRQVGIELEPAERPVLGGELHPLAAAGRAGAVLAGVGVVGELGLEVLLEHGDLHLHLGDQVGSHAHLVAGRRLQQRRPAGQARNALQRDGAEHPAHVVRVEAAAGAHVELGLMERPQDQAALGLEQRLALGAGEARDQTMVRGQVVFLAHPDHRPQPRRPAGGILDIESEVGQVHLVGVAGADGRGRDRVAGIVVQLGEGRGRRAVWA